MNLIFLETAAMAETWSSKEITVHYRNLPASHGDEAELCEGEWDPPWTAKIQWVNHLQPCEKELVEHHLQLNLVQQMDGLPMPSLYVQHLPQSP
jgi:hypothetical protein